VVSTQITRLATGGQIVLDWSVEKTPESYKVIDLSAGAASLARAQQEEFGSRFNAAVEACQASCSGCGRR
jgi:ABC-type transporter MlaC component